MSPDPIEERLAALSDGLGGDKPSGFVTVEHVMKREPPPPENDLLDPDVAQVQVAQAEAEAAEARSGLVREPRKVKIKKKHKTREAYFWDPPITALLERAVAARMNILIVGPPGSGKSTLLKRVIRNVLGETPLQMSGDGEWGQGQIFGGKEAKDGRTYDRYAPLTIAMMEKSPVILNEIDAIAAERLFSLHQVLEPELEEVVLPMFLGEDGRPLRIKPWAPTLVQEDPNDETSPKKKRRSNFLFTATANTLGRGDDTGLYRGTKPLNEAFLDRIDIVKMLDYPPIDEQAEILVRRTEIAESTAKKMAKLAHLARTAFAVERRLSMTFSIRRIINWAKCVVDLDCTVDEAFMSVVLERAVDEDKVTLMEMFGTVFGRRPTPPKVEAKATVTRLD